MPGQTDAFRQADFTATTTAENARLEGSRDDSSSLCGRALKMPVAGRYLLPKAKYNRIAEKEGLEGMLRDANLIPPTGGARSSALRFGTCLLNAYYLYGKYIVLRKIAEEWEGGVSDTVSLKALRSFCRLLPPPRGHNPSKAGTFLPV